MTCTSARGTGPGLSVLFGVLHAEPCHNSLSTQMGKIGVSHGGTGPFALHNLFNRLLWDVSGHDWADAKQKGAGA